MVVLVCYDVSTQDSGGQKRLRRVAKACKDFGQRVQYSLFECRVGDKEWVVLRNRLIGEIDAKEDSLRFYFLDEDAVKKVEHVGVREPRDLANPLVF
jgi:CRISPR-associated protein Cas2